MFQHIDFDIYMFYLMELSFYWSLLFAMLFQKDYQKKVCSGYLPFLQMGSRDSSVVRALDLLYERS